MPRTKRRPQLAGAIGVSAVVSAVALTGQALADTPGNAARGQRFAERVCVTCHTLDPAVQVVPQGRPASFRMIANAPGMTATALEVWFRTPHPSMPNLVLSDDERSDLIAYIETFRTRR